MKKVAKTKEAVVDRLAKEVRRGFIITDRAIKNLAETVNGLTKTINGLSETVDNLAISANRRFDEIDGKFSFVANEFERIHADDRDIKRALGPLVQISALQEREISDLKVRVGRVERKVGIK